MREHRAGDGQAALVTGAGSGIGRAAALRFARAGYRVAVADIAVDAAEETVRLIAAEGGDAIALGVDVSLSAQVDMLFDRMMARFGRIDVAINNAGIGPDGSETADIEEAVFDRTVAINLKGIWLCMRREIPLMLNHGGGTIVNTSSVVGLVGNARAAAYAATKHGIIGLTKTAALEYSGRGVRVNAVCPGLIVTPLALGSRLADEEVKTRQLALHPIGRFGQPEEVAEAMFWLAGPASGFVTGVALPVDGGWCAP